MIQKDSFVEELEQVSDHLPQCRIKILLVDLNAKVRSEGIC